MENCFKLKLNKVFLIKAKSTIKDNRKMKAKKKMKI